MKLEIFRREAGSSCRYIVTDNGSIYGAYHVIYHDREDGSPSWQGNDGSWARYIHGLRHCISGPALYYPTGLYYFYVKDEDVSHETRTWLAENNIDPLNMTEDERVLLSLFLSGFM